MTIFKNFVPHLALGVPQPSSSFPSIDVIVYVSQGFSAVKECLTAVRKYSSHEQLIIVDDHCDKEIKDYLVSFAAQHSCRLIENFDRLGYSKSLRKAVGVSVADYVVFLDTEIIVNKNWIENLLECACADDRVPVVTPLSNAQIFQALEHSSQNGQQQFELPGETDNGEIIATMVENVSHNDFPLVSFINPQCFMIKREAFNAIDLGGPRRIDPLDVDGRELATKIIQAGLKVRLADNTFVLRKRFGHPENASALSIPPGQDAAIVQQFVQRMAPGVLPSKELSNKSILFLVPSLEGNIETQDVVQEVLGLRACGVNAKMAVPQSQGSHFFFYYREAEESCCIYPNEEALLILASQFDIVIATAYERITDLRNIVRAHPDVLPMYYILDTEPWFFPKNDSDEKRAIREHLWLPGLVCFTNTVWLSEIVKVLCGVKVINIKPSLDKSIYNQFGVKRDALAGSLRITAVVHPDSPWRSPRETLHILRIIKEQYKNGVDIRIFGCNDEELDRIGESKDFNFVNLGQLKRAQIAELLKGSDIFIDVSLYQVLARTGLEAMSVGCAVILPKDSGVNEYAVHGENCLLVDTSQRSEIIAAIEKLIDNREFLQRIRKEARTIGKLFSVRKTVWAQMLLFSQSLATRSPHATIQQLC